MLRISNQSAVLSVLRETDGQRVAEVRVRVDRLLRKSKSGLPALPQRPSVALVRVLRRGDAPHYTKKGEGRLYRYYVCSHALKRGREVCPTKSVPAGEIERFVVDQIRTIGKDPALVADVAARARAQAETNARDLRDEEAALRRSLRNAAREVAECVGGADSVRRLADL